MFCAGPGEVNNLKVENDAIVHFTTYRTIAESYWRKTLVSLLREIAATLHLNLPLGVTNEGQEAIKPISGAVAGDSTEVQVRES